ncbi:MAG: energy transducer TonB [Gammaproteobacteria bacterium]|nr:energy transducer TonB [Gammaproteobacteria bacterium]
MLLHASTAASLHTPSAAARRPGLRLALGGSLLLHGVAVAWMLQEPAPEAVDSPPLVQVAILEAPPPLAPPQPVAPSEPVRDETPPPIAVKAPDGRPEPEPLPEKKPEPEPEPEIVEQAPPEVPTEVMEPTPPEPEPARVAQVEAPQATVTPPVYEADYLRNPPPSYPRLSRRLREEGEVELRVRVDPAGQPVVVELARSSGSGRLDEAALRAVRDWRFEPARRGGQAVEAWVRVPILFKLEA